MKKNEFAFPKAGNEWSEMEWVPAPAQAGMTLRDYFAAKAMAAFMNGKTAVQLDAAGYTATALVAYNMADAMLKRREK